MTDLLSKVTFNNVKKYVQIGDLNYKLFLERCKKKFDISGDIEVKDSNEFVIEEDEFPTYIKCNENAELFINLKYSPENVIIIIQDEKVS